MALFLVSFCHLVICSQTWIEWAWRPCASSRSSSALLQGLFALYVVFVRLGRTPEPAALRSP